MLASAAMFRPPPLPRTLEAALRDLGAAKPKIRIEALRDLTRHAEASRAQVVSALEGALTKESFRFHLCLQPFV